MPIHRAFRSLCFVHMQQEYLAKPRLLANSEIDRALDNCRKVLDHSRKIGLPVAFAPFYETTDRIASTLPRKLGHGKNPGGKFRRTVAFGSRNP